MAVSLSGTVVGSLTSGLGKRDFTAFFTRRQLPPQKLQPVADRPLDSPTDPGTLRPRGEKAEMLASPTNSTEYRPKERKFLTVRQNNRGGPNALEQVGSADPPLAVHCFYGGRHRQHRRRGTEEVYRLGGPLRAAPARLANVHRSVLVRATVCHQVGQRATHRVNVAALQKEALITVRASTDETAWTWGKAAKERRTRTFAPPYYPAIEPEEASTCGGCRLL